MDLDEIKQLINEEGAKIIIVENNKPVMVVLSYEEYKSKGKSQSGRPAPSQERNVQSPAPTPQRPSVQQEGGNSRAELTIDDLPL